jgi:CRISPR/Cas system-associated exonuclease Cas4 (RecB family)
MWVGSVVHETVEDVLRRLQEGNPGFLNAQWVIQEMISGRMRPQWKASRDGLYLKEPKRHVGLLEHHYGYFVTKEEWKRLAESAKTAVGNFLQSPFWKTAHELQETDWLLLEDLETFMLDDVPVWIRSDFAYRDSAGKTIIIDWKTGSRPPKPRNMQLGCYGLFAVEKWGLDPSQVRIVEMNLTRGTWAEAGITGDDLNRTREEIRASIDEIRNLLADPEKNEARPEDFVPSPGRRKCSYCPFLEACADGQEVVPLYGGGRLEALMAQSR